MDQHDFLQNESPWPEESWVCRQRMQLALRAARISVFEVDLNHQRYTFFENAEDIFGLSNQQLLSRLEPLSSLSPQQFCREVAACLVHPNDISNVAATLLEGQNGKSTLCQARMKGPDDSFVWCKLNLRPLLDDGVPVRMIGVITDISDLKRRSQQLEEAVKRDAFTGLYNKCHAQQIITGILQQEADCCHGLILFDLDDFKGINDTYGHYKGNIVLQAVAEQLRQTFRQSDVISRFGGDEFLVFLRKIPGEGFLTEKLQHLLRSHVQGCPVTKSIGAALYPCHGQQFDELFDRADQALYFSKQFKNTATLYCPYLSGKYGREQFFDDGEPPCPPPQDG